MTESPLEWYLTRVLDTIAECVIMIDADGCYAFVNTTAERLLGPKETLVGRRYDDPFGELTTLDDTPVRGAELPYAIVMKSGEPVLDAVYNLALPDGRRIVIDLNAVPFRNEDQQIIGGVLSFSDVTDRIHAEKLASGLSDTTNVVYSSSDFRTIVQSALDRGVEALGCESGVVFVKDDEDWVMRYLSNLPEDMIGIRVPDQDASFTTLTGGPQGGALAYNDAYKDERINNRLMRRFEIKSMLDVTVRVHGRDVADISFIYHSHAIPFTDEDVDFANKLGAIIGLALESVRLEHLREVEHDNAERLREKDRMIRQAYSDVIDAMTGGRLVILGEDEVEGVLIQETRGPYEIREPSALSQARSTVADIVGDIDDLDGLLVAFSEGATNMLKHADGGTYRVGKTEQRVQLILSDSGPGIEFCHLPKAALAPGYSTVQSLGMGFTLMIELMDRVFIRVNADGTLLVLERDV